MQTDDRHRAREGERTASHMSFCCCALLHFSYGISVCLIITAAHVLGLLTSFLDGFQDWIPPLQHPCLSVSAPSRACVFSKQAWCASSCSSLSPPPDSGTAADIDNPASAWRIPTLVVTLQISTYWQIAVHLFFTPRLHLSCTLNCCLCQTFAPEILSSTRSSSTLSEHIGTSVPARGFNTSSTCSLHANGSIAHHQPIHPIYTTVVSFAAFFIVAGTPPPHPAIAEPSFCRGGAPETLPRL
jgi:hypothetical protein